MHFINEKTLIAKAQKNLNFSAKKVFDYICMSMKTSAGYTFYDSYQHLVQPSSLEQQQQHNNRRKIKCSTLKLKL